MTLDGARLDFMGDCLYTLSKVISELDPCYFNIEVKNHRIPGKSQRVSYTKYVTVEFRNHAEITTIVTLGQNSKVEVSLYGFVCLTVV